MRDTRSDLRLAGAFLLGALVLLVLLVGAVVGLRALSEGTPYHVVFRESVAGLQPSSEVRYHGVVVGTVEAVRLRPGTVEEVLVDIEVDPDFPLREGTRATLQAMGITGFYTLELSGGADAAPLLPAGAVIPAEPSLLSELGGAADEGMALVRRLNRIVAASEDDLVASIRASRQVLEETVRVLAEARAAVASVRAVAEDPALRALPGEALAATTRARQTLEELDLAALTREARLVLERFGRLQEALERTATAVARTADSGGEDARLALADLRRASQDLRRLTRRLRDEPSLLLIRRPRGEGKEIPDDLPALKED